MAAELFPAPKPSRTLRKTMEFARRLSRRQALARASEKKRRTTYGGSDWPLAKERCLKRDGYRCVFNERGLPCPGNEFLPWLGVEVHHWQRTVGAGGKNALTNLVTLCVGCHEAAHAGVISRDRIRQRLIVLYGPSAVDQPAEVA